MLHLVSPAPSAETPSLTGATNLLKHFGLDVSIAQTPPPPTYHPLIADLPGKLRTGDPSAKLSSLFTNEYPIIEDEDNLVIPPLGNESLKAFVLEEGPIVEETKKHRHRHRHRHKDEKKRKHRHKHTKDKSPDEATPAGDAVNPPKDAEQERKHKHRHRHKKRKEEKAPTPTTASLVPAPPPTTTPV